jgi:hypothetical protein
VTVIFTSDADATIVSDASRALEWLVSRCGMEGQGTVRSKKNAERLLAPRSDHHFESAYYGVGAGVTDCTIGMRNGLRIS